MSKSRLEWKVGLFVLVGLVLLGVLLIQFSKGMTFLRSTYEITLRCKTAGGLKPRASVLMAGVPVGTVGDIKLAPGGRSVLISLRIASEYAIHKDALFTLEISGFLGDQYVAITPQDDKGPLFKAGDEARAEEPFNLHEFIRKSGGSVREIEELARNLRRAIDSLNTYALNEETLTNLSATIVNLNGLSKRASAAAARIDALVETNGAAFSLAVSNLADFSQEIKGFGTALQSVVATNREGIAESVKNIESSTRMMKTLVEDVQAGKGPIGTLLKNDEFGARMTEIVNNLSVTTSNLNRLGLWGILWKAKPPRTNAEAPRVLSAPKSRAD